METSDSHSPSTKDWILSVMPNDLMQRSTSITIWIFLLREFGWICTPEVLAVDFDERLLGSVQKIFFSLSTSGSFEHKKRRSKYLTLSIWSWTMRVIFPFRHLMITITNVHSLMEYWSGMLVPSSSSWESSPHSSVSVYSPENLSVSDAWPCLC